MLRLFRDYFTENLRLHSEWHAALECVMERYKDSGIITMQAYGT